MKLSKLSCFNFFKTNLLKKRIKPQVKQRSKNAWVKPGLKNSADSSAYNNLVAELWLHDQEEGISFRKVASIQPAT